jgi:hypothetical protein
VVVRAELENDRRAGIQDSAVGGGLADGGGPRFILVSTVESG